MRTIVLAAMLTLTGCGIGGGEDGWHRGKIIDVSTAGWWCSTYEGQIMSGAGNSSVKYEFTITSRDVYEKLKGAQARDIEVNLHYFSPRIYSLCASAHANFVDAITEVK